MAKHKWFVKTYKALGINEAQLYTLWFVFFVSVSILFGYCYFLLFPITKVLLVISPLIFFLFVLATNQQKEKAKNFGLFGLIGMGHFGILFLSLATRIHADILPLMQPYDFYVLPLDEGGRSQMQAEIDTRYAELRAALDGD